MSSAITASGIALDIFGVAAPLHLDLRWIELVGFLIFVLIVFFKWGAQNKQIQKLEDKQPVLKVTPKIDGKCVFLEIENKGHEEAIFEGRILEWNGIEDIGPVGHTMEYFYNVRWELWDIQKTKPIDTKLKAEGGNNRAKIVDDAGSASVAGDKIQYRNISIPDSRAFTFWTAKVKTNTKLRFTIQILSQPPLKKHFKQSYYLIINNNGTWKFLENQNDLPNTR
jgi:hypothetical protein